MLVVDKLVGLFTCKQMVFGGCARANFGHLFWRRRGCSCPDGGFRVTVPHATDIRGMSRWRTIVTVSLAEKIVRAARLAGSLPSGRQEWPKRVGQPRWIAIESFSSHYLPLRDPSYGVLSIFE